MIRQQQQQQKEREVSEIVRRNVKQVIQILLKKGFQYEQYLIDQYMNGEKSQYQFLLPKSKHYRYYTQQLAAQMSQERQRKLASSCNEGDNVQQLMYGQQENENYDKAQNSQQSLFVVGTVQQVSVGAMCELIKQLRQNKEPYEPFDNEVYEQQLTLNLSDPSLDKKIQPIIDMIQLIKSPQKQSLTTESQEKSSTNKIDLLRGELGTQKDGSMGAWGGKKYQGLGMRDQFTDYRKQVSKNFYQSIR